MPPMEMSKCLIYINRDEDMKLQYMFKVLTFWYYQSVLIKWLELFSVKQENPFINELKQ